MNKIVFLLVATLACANAALLTDTNDAEEALLLQYNNGQLWNRLQVSGMVSELKKMATESDIVTTADADDLAEATKLLADGGARIAKCSGNKEAVAAEVKALFDNAEPKLVAFWNEDVKKNKTTDENVVYGHWEDSRTKRGLFTDSAEKTRSIFAQMRNKVDEVVSVAEEICSVVGSTVYTRLNNSLTEVHRLEAAIVDIITVGSTQSDIVTLADAETLTTFLAKFYNIVDAILEGSDETGSEVRTKIDRTFRLLSNTITYYLSNHGLKVKATVNETILAQTAVRDLFAALKSQINTILEYAPKIAAMGSVVIAA